MVKEKVEAQVLVFVLNHAGLNPTNPAGSRVPPGEFEVRAQTSKRRRCWWGGDPTLSPFPDALNLLHQTSTESGTFMVLRLLLLLPTCFQKVTFSKCFVLRTNHSTIQPWTCLDHPLNVASNVASSLSPPASLPGRDPMEIDHFGMDENGVFHMGPSHRLNVFKPPCFFP